MAFEECCASPSHIATVETSGFKGCRSGDISVQKIKMSLVAISEAQPTAEQNKNPLRSAIDPLSIAGSVAGLVTLAAATTRAVNSLIANHKSFPKVLLVVAQQSEALHSVLQDLDNQLKRDVNPVDVSAVRNGIALALAGCATKLQEIKDLAQEATTDPANQAGRRGQTSFRIPFGSLVLSSKKQKDLHTLQNELEHFKSSLTLMLQIATHHRHAAPPESFGLC